GSARRVRFPLPASGAPPIVLARAESAVVAFVHPEALDVLADQLFDELEIVAALGRRRKELRLEQTVESEQRRIARQLLLAQRARRGGSLLRQRQREDCVEQVERRILLLIGLEHPMRLCGAASPTPIAGRAAPRRR